MNKYPTFGLVVGKATLINKELADYTINHVPPESMDIADVNTEHLERELNIGLLEIANELDWKEGQEVMFFIEYSKEAGKR